MCFILKLGTECTNLSLNVESRIHVLYTKLVRVHNLLLAQCMSYVVRGCITRQARFRIPMSSRKSRFVGRRMRVNRRNTQSTMQYRTHSRLSGGGGGGFSMYSTALMYFRYIQYSSVWPATIQKYFIYYCDSDRVLYEYYKHVSVIIRHFKS